MSVWNSSAEIPRLSTESKNTQHLPYLCQSARRIWAVKNMCICTSEYFQTTLERLSDGNFKYKNIITAKMVLY
jgi:hypothetical protein